MKWNEDSITLGIYKFFTQFYRICTSPVNYLTRLIKCALTHTSQTRRSLISKAAHRLDLAQSTILPTSCATPHSLFVHQAAAEKIAKQLQHQNNEIQSKLDETNRTLNDFDSAKKKLSIENSDLLRQLEEAESQVSQLSKIKISLTTQLEDTKRLADEEGRVSAQSFPIAAKVADENVFCKACQTRLTSADVKPEAPKRALSVGVKPFTLVDTPHLTELKRKTSVTETKKEYYSVLPGLKFQ